MKSITILSDDYVEDGSDNQLDLFGKIGTKCAVTDFSILLGAFVSGRHTISEGKSLKDRTGWYWTKTQMSDRHVYTVNTNGWMKIRKIDKNSGCCRPVMSYSSINKQGLVEKMGPLGVLEVEYGEYPQTVVSGEVERTLNQLFKVGNLIKTGKVYTSKIAYYGFIPGIFEEYEYNGEKYVCVFVDLDREGKTLSDGRVAESGTQYWVKVEPIVWYVDEKSDLLVSKKLLFSGLPFSISKEYRGPFDGTEIQKFIDDYFSKEIEPIQTYDEVEDEKVEKEVIEVEEEQQIDERKRNPYDFDFEDKSEEEIIRGAIESDIAVFLHGKSGEGKSSRVKQIDPDCVILYLRNATPDSLNGKSVYNESTGEMIDVPPTWYKKIKEKCEAEPDKLHILFFDEITNALPSIQGMAFNIILDKEVNGIWKLPDNCRIVAAGNDLNDSLAANQLAEPLFNRFAHVYIETTVDKWLRWAAKPENHIHPSIYAYLAYKSYTGSDVLRTEFNGETPNADNRKWEMASKMLWTAKKPSMLRSLIGEELTIDFMAFCKKQVITVEDVVKGNYTEKDLEMNLDEKFATAVGLSSCKEEDLKVVREFVGKLGKEIQATFDVLWSHGDEDRIEKISKIKMESTSKGIK